MASDKIGRKASFLLAFVLQAGLIVALSQTREGSFLASTFPLAVLSALIGANYGANLALFPSVTKDYYGLKNFGVNYGLVFTAWGMGGFMLALLAGRVFDQSGSFVSAYYFSAVLLIAAAAMTLVLKPPHHREA
jgi:OFA family oxalate/formate antiporter-like MFS transporter